MSTERDLHLNPPMEQALAQLKATIIDHDREATFALARDEDPEGIYRNAIVDLEDVDQVPVCILGKLYEIQVEKAMLIYVIPLQPVDRVLKVPSHPWHRSRPRIDWQAQPSSAQP